MKKVKKKKERIEVASFNNNNNDDDDDDDLRNGHMKKFKGQGQMYNDKIFKIIITLSTD